MWVPYTNVSRHCRSRPTLKVLAIPVPVCSVRARATRWRRGGHHERPGHARARLGEPASAGGQRRPGGEHVEIGRASWRERGEGAVGGVGGDETMMEV